ncbi:hypothetical protein H4582DRAFT_2057867 [Lactarius indigo]|nr:hypothetical protein H4582DRAFT_2057867 [Lactarius indigo]
MCDPPAFDNALRNIDEDPATFVASPTVDELLAIVTMLAPSQLQENDDLPSSDSAVTNALQASISGEYFGGSVSSRAIPRHRPGEIPFFECVAGPSLALLFCAMVPSPVSTMKPSPPAP